MNKKKLRAIPYKKGYEKAFSMTDLCEANMLVVTAQVKIIENKKILNIDLWNGKTQKLEQRMFFSNNEMIYLSGDKWTVKSFIYSTLYYKYCFYSPEVKDYVYNIILSENDKVIMQKFFKSDDATFVKLLRGAEEKYKEIRSSRNKSKVMEQIARDNASLNKIPKKVFNYARKVANHYLMQDKDGNSTCTCCNHIFNIKPLKHLSNTTCPDCKTSLQVQRMGKCKQFIHDLRWTMYNDNTKDGVQVNRYILNERVIRVNKKEQTFVYQIDELIEKARFFNRNKNKTMETQPNGFYWHYGTRNYFSMGSWISQNKFFCELCKIYPYNFDSWVKEYFVSQKNEFAFWGFNARWLLSDKYNACFEKLYKSGLTGVINDFMYANSYAPEAYLDITQSSLLPMLKINRNELALLQYKPSLDALTFLQKINTDNQHIRYDDYKAYTENIGYDYNSYRKLECSAVKFVSYAKKQADAGYIEKKEEYPFNYFINSYLNYRDLMKKYAEILGYDYNSKSNKFPKNFHEADIRLTNQIKEYKEEKRRKEAELFNKTYSQVAEEIKKSMRNSKDIKRFMKGTSGLIVKIPESAEELKKEGNRLGNCLSTYVEKVARGETTIFFIRRLEDPDKEYYAMEYKDGRVKQLHGKGNCTDKEGNVTAFADALCKVLVKINFQPPKFAIAA